MNYEKENVQQKIKKYSIAISSVMLIVAIMAVAAVTSNDLAEDVTTTAPADENVEAELTNVPDTRNNETLIVPATEITTETAQETTTEEPTTADTAPASYILPLGTDIGNDYSMGVPVYNSVMGDWRTHDGVDFNGNYGDGVKAIADGTITEIGEDAVMGSFITVNHGGGVEACYYGVTASDSIAKGMKVTQGDKIGTVGTIPGEADADYPHIHLEIRVDGEISDPIQVMGYYE
ncbi:MAG: M23 family metallopeptidase [Clostridia bacterium]|nr:M23 family metallopeptidase [Clostridia bacterium]